MRRILFSLALLLAIPIGGSLFGQAAPIAAPTSVAGAPRQAPVDASQADPQKDSRSAHWGNTPETWGLIATFLYTLVSGLMLLAIFAQNRSIQNTDRAVLIPVWENFIHLSPEQEPRRPTFLVQFKNCGKTPAFIRGHQSNLRLLESVKDLPHKPEYRSEVRYQGDPLVPDGQMDAQIYSQLDDPRGFEEIEADFRTNGRVLFAYGFVRYSDIYGREHITRYGLRYAAEAQFTSRDHWVVDGPETYNQYT